MTLPWGKYQGQRIDRVPASYLAWLVEESRIGEPYRYAIKGELVRRLDLGRPIVLVQEGCTPPRELADTVAELIAAGYRSLVRRDHPDVGGSIPSMQAVNAARAWLDERGLLRARVTA
jgi:putative quorum-sensing-regulated virulence factor